MICTADVATASDLVVGGLLGEILAAVGTKSGTS
jgi:hypothetical protein